MRKDGSLNDKAPHYGIDAPGIMLTMLSLGVAGLLVGAWIWVTLSGWVGLAGLAIAGISAIPACLGTIMLLYSLVGKKRMRDFMISLIRWRGDERVLDIGTGMGLLLIAAAKQLGRGGNAVGIDIWRKEDLSGSPLEQLALNIDIEGVENRVSILTEDARKLSFEDDSFDVVLSLLCIHNIEEEGGQRRACQEIARVLKPGGTVLVGEYIPTHSYAATFREIGLTVAYSRTFFLTALGPMWLVMAEKPRSRG